VAGIYACVHGSFKGGGAKKGMMWLWWAVDGFVMFVIGGAAMGWAAERWGGLES